MLAVLIVIRGDARRLLALLPTTMVSKAEDIVAEIEAELQSERETLQVRSHRQ